MNRRIAFIERLTEDEDFAKKRQKEWAERRKKSAGGISNDC